MLLKMDKLTGKLSVLPGNCNGTNYYVTIARRHFSTATTSYIEFNLSSSKKLSPLSTYEKNAERGYIRILEPSF